MTPGSSLAYRLTLANSSQVRSLLTGTVELGRGVDVADDGAAAFQGVGKQPTQQVQGLVQVLGFVAHHQHSETGAVAGDDDAVAILDQAPRRRNHAEVELVLRREGRILLSLHDLELGQPPYKRRHAEGRQAAEHEGAPQERALSFIDVGEKMEGSPLIGSECLHRRTAQASSQRPDKAGGSGRSADQRQNSRRIAARTVTMT